jgi:predicted nucleotidyltransferase
MLFVPNIPMFETRRRLEIRHPFASSDLDVDANSAPNLHNWTNALCMQSSPLPPFPPQKIYPYPQSRPWHENKAERGLAAMNRTHALELLARSKSILTARYGVTRLALFGSTARDAARETSDVDILVTFDGPATSERYFGVQFYLEDLFGCPVDLVTDKALRPELRPFIENEAVYV